MTKHISFPSIDQFRNVVKQVRDRAKFHQVPVPTITFTGTVKLHGTNAAVCQYFDPKSDVGTWVQSRSNVITPESDNAGFASFVNVNTKEIGELFDSTRDWLEGSPLAQKENIIGIYGEWCGAGVQKGVAISQLPKMFVIFAIAIIDASKIDDNGNVKYTWLSREDVEAVFDIDFDFGPNIKCIFDFDTWEIDIDFNSPEQVQNQLGRFTEEVENRCPVGAALGVDGTGEGIVWKASYCDNEDFRINDLIFKVKGEKHSVTRVKTLASVDIEKVNSIKEFVDSVLTDARVSQAISVMREQGLDPVVENTGAFLKWIGGDVIKEESDTMEANGLDRKEVMPILNREARQKYMKLQLNTI